MNLIAGGIFLFGSDGKRTPAAPPRRPSAPSLPGHAAERGKAQGALI
jgi:hypothetical protein